MPVRIAINLFNYRFKFSWMLKRVVSVKGTYSLCSDGKHIVYLDYDRIDSDALKLEVRNIQKQYALGTFYIFESSEGNHHAVCLDKVTPEQYELIINSTNCDPDFKRHNRFNRMGSRVLRFSDKGENKTIKYLYQLDNKSSRVKSNAHADFLVLYYRIRKEDAAYDGSSKLFICEYQTPI